jgi:hypothetical protein
LGNQKLVGYPVKPLFPGKAIATPQDRTFRPYQNSEKLCFLRFESCKITEKNGGVLFRVCQISVWVEASGLHQGTKQVENQILVVKDPNHVDFRLQFPHLARK